MSERDLEDNRSRGSSRSSLKSRDDRYCKESEAWEKEKRSEKRVRRDRSRSRDRPRRRSRSREDKYDSRNRREPDTIVREMSISPQREEAQASNNESSHPPPPPSAPRISKISIGFKTAAPKSQPIKMSLIAPTTQTNVLSKKPTQVASVFNDGSDDEPEEMPAEARMRMRNIGRDTPTSVGPNSFGKTKHGFCDEKAIFQKNLKEAMDKVNPTSHSTAKYSTTVYKLTKQ